MYDIVGGCSQIIILFYSRINCSFISLISMLKMESNQMVKDLVIGVSDAVPHPVNPYDALIRDAQDDPVLPLYYDSFTHPTNYRRLRYRLAMICTDKHGIGSRGLDS